MQTNQSPEMKMSLAQKTFRNFLVANLCALVPMWVVTFGWMPDQVKVEARGTESVALVADGAVLQGEEHGTWKEGTVWRFYLRKGMEWKDLTFRLPEGMDAGDVGRVWMEKWKLLSLGKSGNGLVRKEGEKNEYAFNNPRFRRIGFAQGKIPFGVAGGEVLLMGISLWFAKKYRDEQWKTLWPSVLGVAFGLALLMQVVLPVQSYVANRSAFPFSPGELGGAIAIRFIVELALGGLTLGLLARCFGRWILAPVLAFTACSYLESGVLSLGLPSLNGNWRFFENTTRAFWHGTVWIAVFAIMCVLHGVLKKHYGKASLCLSILIGVSLLDVHPEPKPDSSKWIVDEFLPKDVVAHSVVYASSNNVLVFVIDSLECAQAHAIMGDPVAGPRLREQFRGFTEYTNNIGTGDYSAVAVANLLTGKYPETTDGIVDYYNSIFSEESVLKDYMDAGYAVFFSGEDRDCTNRKKTLVSKEKRLPIMERRVLEGQRWTLPDINRFRWIPFAIKLRYLCLSGCSLPGGDFSREWDLYPILGDAEVDSKERGTFLFVHTDGVHVPVLYNRNGEQMPKADNSDAACVEMGIYVLKQLGNLLDDFRRKGIYDNALIIVLADHGNHGNLGIFSGQFSASQTLPTTARPFLWVKPVGCTNGFTSSSLPTSHSKISRLLRIASQRILEPSEIQNMLQQNKRLYRQVFVLENKKNDWIVDDIGEAEPPKLGFVGEGFSSHELHPFQQDVTCSLHINQWKENAKRIQLDCLHCNTVFPSFYPDYNTMGLSIRVKNPVQRYKMAIKLTFWRFDGVEPDVGTCFVFGQNGHPETGLTLERGDAQREKIEAVIDGLVPDENGVIRLVGERGNGFTSFVEFTHLRLEESH